MATLNGSSRHLSLKLNVNFAAALGTASAFVVVEPYKVRFCLRSHSLRLCHIGALEYNAKVKWLAVLRKMRGERVYAN